ncbi:M48 family metallopeptidase [Halofilum ochraceum]|uniref:M48 family metallopeptidase n=1 Tax=Halofilum ochraceum TaxID=1611323 RepID=UPI0008D9EFF9|nr:M48 family metallopeptidase [Halofilum ochraceum]
MTAPDGNPRPREGINSTETSGLGEFAILVCGLGCAAVALTAILTLSVGWLAPWIPFSWETAVAGDVDPAGETEHPRAEAALQELSEELARHAELPAGMRVRMHLSDSEQPNAFATLGGHVIVTRGLLQSVSSENALAMVLAHEIAHVEHRHPIQALGRSAVVSLVWAVLAGATGQSAVQDVLGNAGLLTMLGFNREMERVADRDALATLRARYGHTRGAAEFFRTLQARRGGESAEWTGLFQTHPRTAERLQTIARRAADTSDAAVEPLPEPIAALAEPG